LWGAPLFVGGLLSLERKFCSWGESPERVSPKTIWWGKNSCRGLAGSPQDPGSLKMCLGRLSLKKAPLFLFMRFKRGFSPQGGVPPKRALPLFLTPLGGKGFPLCAPFLWGPVLPPEPGGKMFPQGGKGFILRLGKPPLLRKLFLPSYLREGMGPLREAPLILNLFPI